MMPHWREVYTALCYEFADEISARANMRKIVIPLLVAHRKGVISALTELRRFGFRGTDDGVDELRQECREVRKAVCHARRRLREQELALPDSGRAG